MSTDFLQVDAGSWLSRDGRYEVYLALEERRARWRVWDSDEGGNVDPDDATFRTRAEATLWLLESYAPTHP